MSTPEAPKLSLETLKERLDIHIRFSPHTTLEDFGDLDNEVRRGGYDFYAPEFAGHTPERVAIVERVAKGETRAYENTMVGFSKLSVAAIFRAIFASRIAVIHADASMIQLKADSDLREFGSDRDAPSLDNLEQWIAYTDERAQLGARATAKRDALFVQNLEAELPPRILSHPRLNVQERIGVLITIGDNHLTLLRNFEAEEYRVRASGLPEVYFATEDALITHLNGQKPTDELLLEAVANNFIRPQLYHPRTNELRKSVRKITSSLSESDVESLIELAQRGDKDNFYSYLNIKMHELEIDDPELRLEAIPIGTIPKQ